jgi:hypothetical protein
MYENSVGKVLILCDPYYEIMQMSFKLYIWNNINPKGPKFLIGYSSKMLGEGISLNQCYFEEIALCLDCNQMKIASLIRKFALHCDPNTNCSVFQEKKMNLPNSC